MSEEDTERGSLKISFDGMTSTERRTQKSAPTPDEEEVDEGDGDGVVRKADRSPTETGDDEDDDSSRTAQEIIDARNEDPSEKRTAQDLIEDRGEAVKEAMSGAANPFEGDEEVVKAEDDLEMPSYDGLVAEATKSEAEKRDERLAEEIAKRMDLSASESSPSDGEGVSLSTIMQDRPKVGKAVESYIREGGSLGDSLDDVKRWAGA